MRSMGESASPAGDSSPPEGEGSFPGDGKLEATLETLRVYRKNDPKLERATADYVDAEASLKEDPAQGRRVGAYRE